VEGLVERGTRNRDADALRDAWTIVIDPSLSPRITEDPRFNSLQGYVAAKQWPPKLDDARRFFANVFTMKYTPHLHHLRAWYLAERESGFGFDYCMQIVDFVAGSRKYSDLEKIEFLSRKATLLFARARDDRFVDPSRAVKNLKESLKVNLSCYAQNEALGTVWTIKSEEWCRNTGYAFFDLALGHRQYDEFLVALTELSELRAIFLDPIEEPLVRAFTQISDHILARGESHKVRNRLGQTRRELDNERLWHDSSARRRVIDKIDETLNRIGKSASEMGARAHTRSQSKRLP
jgi:hypothetical protein